MNIMEIGGGILTRKLDFQQNDANVYWGVHRGTTIIAAPRGRGG